MCSIYYNGMFDTTLMQLPSKVLKKNDVGDELDAIGDVAEFILEKDLLCKEIEYCSRKYKVGDLVVLKREERDSLEVGLIKSIFVRKTDVNFVIKRFHLILSDLGVFENSRVTESLEIISVTSLQDSYPLHMKGNERQFVVVFHHHVSCSYTA